MGAPGTHLWNSATGPSRAHLAFLVPDAPDAVQIKRFIFDNHRRLQQQRLRSQQAVERIAMMKRERTEQIEVIRLDRQECHPQFGFGETGDFPDTGWRIGRGLLPVLVKSIHETLPTRSYASSHMA